MTLEDIRRQFSKPPAEYPKTVDNPGSPCPWCGKLVEYRYPKPGIQPSGWKCPGCQREGYFSVEYQFDTLEASGEDPVDMGDPCPQCGNPVRNIWTLPNLTRGGDEWWCRYCRTQGEYQKIPDKQRRLTDVETR